MIGAILVFYALLLWVACRFRRQVKTLGDFFLAGRTLGALPVALTFTASWFGAGSTLASMTLFHQRGLAGAWELAIPSVLSCLLITFAFSRRVSRQNALSQPEAVQRHYGRLGRLGLSVVILMAVSTFLGSQLVAAAMIFQAVFGVDTTLATLLFTGLVVGYTMLGGFYTVVMTDMAQMALIVLALALLLGFCLLGHPGDPLLALSSAMPRSFSAFVQPWGYHAALCATFVMAWSIAPEMWQRMTATRDEHLAFRAALTASGILAGLFVLVALIGLLSTGLLARSEQVFMDLAKALPPVLGGVALAGVLAAISSTMDSSLNVGSLTLTRDLYQGFYRPQASTRELLWVSRVATLLVAIPGVLLALKFQNIIRILWISADIYASAMFVPIVGILFLKHPPRWGGILAMGGGVAVVAFNALIQYGIIATPWAWWPQWPYSTLVGVAASLLGFGLGWAIAPKTSAGPPAAAASRA